MAISETDSLDGLRIATNVEREQRAEATVHVAGGQRIRLQAGVAHELDSRMLRQAARELERRRRLALHPDAQCLEAAEQERGGVGRRDRARARAELEQPLVVFLAPADEDAEQQVVMAAQELRGAVQHEVRAVLERPHVDRRGSGGVHEHGCRARRGCSEVGEGQERVRRRLEPDQIGAGRRRRVWSNSRGRQPPAPEIADQHSHAVVRIGGDRDSLSLTQQAQQRCRRRGEPRREEQRVTAVELSQRGLGGLARRCPSRLYENSRG